ncbi:hypothetical protein OTB20_18800 [Streptomyces sp. H27-H1]|uniref:hypothetical protein n=1 Tax=Streptomyces sp. H27-H1 TaxID=2996461 RepID=UPI00226F36C3|nr:hypothetical protein [Streptomyces sp. H27-H1]MCY0928207.1 hypothetical protein [Streptomyces sp. H27-H1]
MFNVTTQDLVDVRITLAALAAQLDEGLPAHDAATLLRPVFEIDDGLLYQVSNVLGAVSRMAKRYNDAGVEDADIWRDLANSCDSVFRQAENLLGTGDEIAQWPDALPAPVKTSAPLPPASLASPAGRTR